MPHDTRDDTPVVLPGGEDLLSPRLVDVLSLVADGYRTEDIARKLGLSPHTVKNYVERILDRLDARDRAEAVAIALRKGILE